MKQYTIYIGTDGAPTTVGRARARITELAHKYLRLGHTTYSAMGSWLGTEETTYVVTVLAGEGNRIWDFARAVRRELTQECVLVTEQDIAATYVSGSGSTYLGAE